MGKNKLIRFAEMKNFSNTYEFPEDMNGTWRRDVFKNENPIVLELACGRGEYSIGLAKLFPEKNIMGVDIKGSRIWRGAKTALEEQLSNAAFLRTYIESIANYFDSDEVDEIWITFPDPHLKARKHRKRLTSLRFLKEYTRFVKDGGLIHLKTDDDLLYAYTKAGAEFLGLPILDDVQDVLAERKDDKILSIRTTYEKRWIEEKKKIKYLKMELKHSLFTAENMKKADALLKEWMLIHNPSKEH